MNSIASISSLKQPKENFTGPKEAFPSAYFKIFEQKTPLNIDYKHFVAAACFLGVSYALLETETGLNVLLTASSVKAALFLIKTREAALSRSFLMATVSIGIIGALLLSSRLTSQNAASLVPKDYMYLQDCHSASSNDLGVKSYGVSCLELEAGKRAINAQNLITRAEKASTGHTPTFLLKDAGIVIKEDSWNRAFNNQKALELCEKSGYRSIKVAEATVYKNFIIERLLPIAKQDLFFEKEQIGIYLDNLDGFTQAVKEFTGFLCQVHHDDLNSHKAYNLLANFAYDHTPRFDNAALYLENGVGQIAIPDLDSLELVPSSPPKIEDAIRFFPFHYDVIIEEAKKYDQGIDRENPKLLKIRDNALKYYENVYTKHLNHINSNQINASDPSFIPELDDHILNKIQDSALERVYESLLASYSPEDCLDLPSKEEFLKLLKVAFKETKSIEGLRKLLVIRLSEKKVSSDDLETNGKLLKFRSLALSKDHDEHIEMTVETLSQRLEGLHPDFRKIVALMSIRSIFKEFETHGIIASYRTNAYAHVIFA